VQEDDTRSARFYKCNPHIVLPEHDISIWVDGNIYPNVSDEELVRIFLGQNDITTFKHPGRRCTYSEAKAVIRHGLDDPQVVNAQMMYYKANKFPVNYGLPETTMIIRRNTFAVNKFNEDWWAEIQRWSKRDQLSFMPVKKQNSNLKVAFVRGDIRNNKYFTYKQHLR
jgi:hypothetical protein